MDKEAMLRQHLDQVRIVKVKCKWITEWLSV